MGILLKAERMNVKKTSLILTFVLLLLKVQWIVIRMFAQNVNICINYRMVFARLLIKLAHVSLKSA